VADLAFPIARAAFAGLIPNTGRKDALWVEERCGLGLVTILARAGQEAALAANFQDSHALALPRGPRCVSRAGTSVIATGPGAWLATQENATPGWAEEMSARLAGCASVSDQSGGYAVLRIGGAQARMVLAKGIFLDLHPDVFTPGSAAVTDCAHMGVILWRESDEDVYTLALFRSYAASFAHWLTTSARLGGLPGVFVRA
jgi:methylglutamate dehydrogenase subunit D